MNTPSCTAPEGTDHRIAFSFAPRDSKAFSAACVPHCWIIPDLLVAGQPAVIGGPKKCLKTSIAIDLAVSAASGWPFLGAFRVERRARVVVLSGESGHATLLETARRVCRAKAIPLEQCDVWWQPDLPRLGDPDDLQHLHTGLASLRAGVVIIDPLYLCLLGGGTRVDASNLYQVGPLLFRAARACLDAGATPIFVHHTTKGTGKREPLDLDDLAYAGIGEFARQWLLVSRREPYRAGTGRHNLFLAAGGSAGHSSVWCVDVNEGAGFGGRQWGVQVSKAPG